MDRLFDHIHNKHTPKLNRAVCDGVAVEHMRSIEGYIDRIIRCAEEGFPEGLKYIDYERCTPQEEYNEVTRKRNNRRSFDLSRSDVYMVRYHFSFDGEELFPLFLYLPFVSDGGLIRLRGSLYSISPVLADKAISVGQNSLFIPLTRDKLTFKRLIQHYYVNGKQENTYVIWSTVYHRSERSLRNAGKPTIKMESSLAHYLFCKYGLTRTFAQFADAEVVVGDETTITEQTHPQSEWFICSSTGIKPRGLARGAYTGSGIRLAVRTKEWSQTVAGLVGGFFYIVDHFPERVLPEYVDNERLWKILLGHVIFASHVSEGKLAEDIETHMISLDEYIDRMARDNLADDGVYVTNVFELFAHVIETFAVRVMASGDDIGSMYGKRLTVLRYVSEPIIRGIFGFMYRLRSAKKPVTKEDIQKNLKMIPTELILSINYEHGEVKPIASPSDNKIFNITSNVVPQTSSKSGARASTKSTLVDPSKFLHASIAEVGSFSHQPKSEPTGRSKLNPCVRTEPDGLIVRDPDKISLIDSVQEKIRRR